MNFQEWFNQLKVEEKDYQTIIKEVEELRDTYGYKFIGIGARNTAEIKDNKVIFGNYKPLILGFSNILDHDFKEGVREWVLGGREQSAIINSATFEIVF